MPTPVGHSLAGLTVLLLGRARDVPQHTRLLLVFMLASLPDIDFLPGYLRGQPGVYHWGVTHSIAAALLVGVAAGLIGRARLGTFRPLFLLATAAYGSHILLDLLLGPGAAPAVGLQVFWPLSTDRYMLPWSVFKMFPASIEQVGPIYALFSRDSLPLIVRELTVMIPVCVAALWWRRALDRKSAPE